MEEVWLLKVILAASGAKSVATTDKVKSTTADDNTTRYNAAKQVLAKHCPRQLYPCVARPITSACA